MKSDLISQEFLVFKIWLFLFNGLFIAFLFIHHQINMLSKSYPQDSLLVSNAYLFLLFSVLLFILDFSLTKSKACRFLYLLYQKNFTLKKYFFSEQNVNSLLIAKYRASNYGEYLFSFFLLLSSWLLLIILSTLCEEENLIYYSYFYILFAYPTLYFLLYYIFTISIIKNSAKMPLQYACSIGIINSQEIENYEAEKNKIISHNIKTEQACLSEKIIINKDKQSSRTINRTRNSRL